MRNDSSQTIPAWSGPNRFFSIATGVGGILGLAEAPVDRGLVGNCGKLHADAFLKMAHNRAFHSRQPDLRTYGWFDINANCGA